MDLRQVAKDTSKVLSSYLTYQALKTVMAQLSETNPPQALWLSGFAARHSVQDGEAFLQALLQEQQELAFRLMTLRKHLAEEVADYLPEMVRTGIQQSNMVHKRQHLERMTQLTLSEPPSRSEQPTDLED
ncbi:MAG TPA: RbcX chaperonin protein [Cyanobacteria bacterium UBA8543]|nr:RbcX chaperonin protein [Cyanobacteria bacterium UBA8543]